MRRALFVQPMVLLAVLLGVMLGSAAAAAAGLATVDHAATITSNSIENDCLLPLPRLSFFAPLVFTPNGVLRSTETNANNNEPIIRIPAGETVVLSCAPNHFKLFPLPSVQVTCKTGQTLIVNDQEQHFRKVLGCEVRAIEEILAPVRGCDTTPGPAALTAIEYGFTNPISNRSYVLGEACYDPTVGRTTFVHTTFRTDYKNYDLDRVALRHSDNASYFDQAHPASRYKIDFLKASRVDLLGDRLTETFGFRQAPQLQPHRFVGEELLLNQQFSNVIKLGWNYMMVGGEQVADRMAHAVADMRAKLQHEGVADVYVGTHGVLRTMDRGGANTEVYLADGRFPVAKFVWMVAVARQSGKAIAYVVPNGQGQSAAELCPNRCGGAAVAVEAEGDGEPVTSATPGRRHSRMTTTTTTEASKSAARPAMVHCCEYKDLQSQVAEMPALEGTAYTLLQ